VHEGACAAACCTVKFQPPARIVVVRGDVSALDATLNVTVPGPVVAAPAVTVTQAAWLTAVHWQVLPVVTAKLPLPPAAAKDWL